MVLRSSYIFRPAKDFIIRLSLTSMEVHAQAKERPEKQNDVRLMKNIFQINDLSFVMECIALYQLMVLNDFLHESNSPSICSDTRAKSHHGITKSEYSKLFLNQNPL